MGHLVVSTTKLEGEDRLKVLSLEKDLAFESVGDVDGMCERCFFNDIVYPRCEDQAKVLSIVRKALSIILDIYTHQDIHWARGILWAPWPPQPWALTMAATVEPSIRSMPGLRVAALGFGVFAHHWSWVYQPLYEGVI
jgi:hypothetical protein